MIQNRVTFSQSSVELEIIGLPDYSANDDSEKISIISNWKLNILNQPTIEGGIEHLKEIINAFYQYSFLILLDKEVRFESKLIDISLNNEAYLVNLKSTKPEIKPLNIKINNAEFSDIINCLDQLKKSDNVKLNLNDLIPNVKKQKIKLSNKKNLISSFFPPFLAIISISFLTFIGSYFFEFEDTQKNKNVSMNLNSLTGYK